MKLEVYCVGSRENTAYGVASLKCAYFSSLTTNRAIIFVTTRYLIMRR
jgi:hypothetical protein